MTDYTKEQLDEALVAVSSIICRCEKMDGKFVEGTAQYSLLKNRIKALRISEALITTVRDALPEQVSQRFKELYPKDELEKALPPVISIIRKCEKAQSKYAEGTAHYNRFAKMIQPLQLSKTLLEETLSSNV